MQYDCFFVFGGKNLRPIIEELIWIRPSIAHFITTESDEWIRATPLGNNFYSFYSPHKDLQPKDVLDIISLSLMSFDSITLQRFSLSMLPTDFIADIEEHGIIRKHDNIQYCMGFIKTCLHYYNCAIQCYGNSRVFLYQQNGVWKIMSITALVDNREVLMCLWVL